LKAPKKDLSLLRGTRTHFLELRSVLKGKAPDIRSLEAVEVTRAVSERWSRLTDRYALELPAAARSSPKLTQRKVCGPSGVGPVGPASRFSCQFASLCPWCWARQLVRRSTKVLAARLRQPDFLGADKVETAKLRAGWKLVVGRHLFLNEDTRNEPGVSIELASGWLSAAQRKIARPSRGSAHFAAVWPVVVEETGKLEWAFLRRWMNLVPADTPLKPGERAYPVGSARKAGAGIVRFARYPLEALDAPGPAVKRLLDHRVGRRFLRFHGGFHAPGSRK
jgi:hypothetical protein